MTGSLVVVAALVGGVLFGDGLARTVVETADGSTWLADDQRGQVVQVNPTTGRPETRLQAGQPGAELEVRQRDGLLVVTDRRTGVISSIDLATLLTTGRRQVTPGGASEVLLDRERMYVVDRDQGTITNVEPSTTRTVGETWRSPTGFADTAVDGSRRVWALDREGRLYQLNWSDEANRFVEQQQPRPVNGTGSQSILVAHERGVTVLGPEGGVVVQVSTDHDRAVAVPGLRPPLRAADSSPANLVPAAVESTGTVIILRGDEVLEVGVAAVGCAKPGKPAVFRDLIYVPCLGARKVLVLDGNGRQSRPDIVTPEGKDPELVLDDGRLMVNVPGASTGVVVEPDGSTRTVTIHDPAASVHNPASQPPPPAPLTAGNPVDPPAGQTTSATKPNPPKSTTQPPPVSVPVPPPPTNAALPPPPATTTTTTPPPTTTTTPPPTPNEVRPTKVVATARPDGSVLLSWDPGPKRPERYQVLFNATTPTVVTEVPGTATSAVVTTVQPGTTGTFFVLGVPPGAPQSTGLPASPASNQVTVYTRPGAATEIRVERWKFDKGRIYAFMRWAPAPQNGKPVTVYRITVRASNGQTYSADDIDAGSIGRQVATWYTCGDCAATGIKLDIELVAVNEAGPGEPAKTTAEFPPIRLPGGDR